VDLVVTPFVDECQIMVEGGVSQELARKIVRMTQIFRNVTGHDVEMISGHRTCRQQMALARAGRPAAACDVSTHTSCPATGADFRLPGLSDTRVLKSLFGSSVIQAGLRWGGGSPVDPETNIPSDWPHIDLGRRNG